MTCKGNWNSMGAGFEVLDILKMPLFLWETSTRPMKSASLWISGTFELDRKALTLRDYSGRGLLYEQYYWRHIDPYSATQCTSAQWVSRGRLNQNPQTLCSEGITCKILKVSEAVGFRHCKFSVLRQPLMETESASSLISGEILRCFDLMVEISLEVWL